MHIAHIENNTLVTQTGGSTITKAYAMFLLYLLCKVWQPHSRVGPPPTPDIIGACPAGSVSPCSVLGELEVTPVDNLQSGGERDKRELRGPERGKL